MAFSTISFTPTVTVPYTVTKDNTGFTARQESQTVTKKHTFNTIGGAVANAANEVYSALLTIAASGNTTIDLTAVTDVLGNTLNFARIKSLTIWLLAATDTAPDGTTVGTACSGITVGNAATNAFAGSGYPTSDQATGTQTLGNGEVFHRANAGATGWVVDATHKSLKILNNDGSNSAKILIVAGGADS